jgi:hypothetical protein
MHWLWLLKDRPRLPASLEDVDALRVYFRGLVVDNGDALISLDRVNLDGGSAIQWIAKFPQRPHGLVYVG